MPRRLLVCSNQSDQTVAFVCFDLEAAMNTVVRDERAKRCRWKMNHLAAMAHDANGVGATPVIAQEFIGTDGEIEGVAWHGGTDFRAAGQSDSVTTP